MSSRAQDRLPIYARYLEVADLKVERRDVELQFDSTPLCSSRLTPMSVGLDAHQIANKRGRFIEARIQQHIRELDAMPVHGGGILSPALRHQREQQSNS